MKKRILLFTAIAGISYLMVTSYTSGAGSHQYDCSGADVNSGSGNPNGCSTGSGCHGTTAPTTGITVVLELDSAGVTTSSTATGTGHYKPGVTYTVKITGTNTTTNNLPKFGFQVAATMGATAATLPVDAGALQSTGLPSGVHYVAAPRTSSTFYASVVEHTTQLSPSSGTGGSGTVYVESFTWTAPVTGSGTVSIWGALNAVNNDGNNSSADKWNVAQLVLNEISSPSSVTNVAKDMSVVTFPNPVKNELNLQMNNAVPGTYSFEVFDVMGRSVAKGNLDVNGMSDKTTINTSNWAYGTYNVVIEKGGVRQVAQVVKL